MNIQLVMALICLGCISAAPHTIVKRQIAMPLNVAGLGGQMGYGGIQNGFAGVHSGAFGALMGSPIFGPGGIGPFNNPANRERRIDELLNINRRVNGELPLRKNRQNRRRTQDY